jgi:hypothetical protein
MTPERYERIGQLFDGALECPTEERSAYLDHACCDDADLRSDVEKLLARHSASGDFLSRPAIEVAAELLAKDHIPFAAGKKISPVAKDLEKAKAQTIMWSLDGVLRYLPVAALRDGNGYLVEQYCNTVFTPASQSRLLLEPGRKWTALGLGVTKAHGDRIPALPAVADEMRGIIRESNTEGGNQSGALPGTIKLAHPEDDLGVQGQVAISVKLEYQILVLPIDLAHYVILCHFCVRQRSNCRPIQAGHSRAGSEFLPEARQSYLREALAQVMLVIKPEPPTSGATNGLRGARCNY